MNELSAGVQILIDQLKSNPDVFFGPVDVSEEDYLRLRGAGAKFGRWCAIIEDDLMQVDDPAERIKSRGRYTWFMTEPEKEALREAYREAKRLRFDAEIIAALHTKAEDFQQGNYVIGRGISSGVIAQPVQHMFHGQSAQGSGLNAVQYKEAMRLDASGSLGIGTIAPATSTSK